MMQRKRTKRKLGGARRQADAFAAGWPWARAWSRWLEIGWAAPQVVAHRTQRMLRSGLLPSAVDRVEFRRMVDEKGEAWFESMLQMSTEAWKVWFAIAESTMRSWWLASSAWPSGGPRSPYCGAARRWAKSAPNIAYVGLGPIHRRATANARRLARFKAS